MSIETFPNTPKVEESKDRVDEDEMAGASEKIMSEERAKEKESKMQELDRLYEESRELYLKWKELVKISDDRLSWLPQSFWENRARGILNEEVANDPKNADTMRPVIEAREAIKQNIADRKAIDDKIREIESSLE